MRVLLGIVLGILLTGAAIALLLASGGWNVAATSPAGRLEQRIASFALDRSVARRAPAQKNPLSASAEVFASGLAHFRENCVTCHGAPGVDASEIGDGLNPAAPDLTLPRVQRRSDGEMFWIVRNGIRMTGMPAFGPTHRDDEIWKVVAFLRHLPEITPEEQKALRAATEEADHHHEADDGSPEASSGGSPASGASARPTPHTHPPGTRPHRD